MSKTHWKKFFPSDYIGAGDFEYGERKVVTISGTKSEQVTGPSNKKETCLIVTFKQKGVKPLIANVTNSKAISKVSGSSNIEDWVGNHIELYVQEGVKAFGELVDAVRVKQTAPRITKPQLTEQHEAYQKVLKAVQDGFTRDKVEQKYTVSDAIWDKLTEPQEAK